MKDISDRLFRRTIAEVLAILEASAAEMMRLNNPSSPRLTWERVCKQHIGGGEHDGSVVIVMTLRGNRVGRIFNVATLVFRSAGEKVEDDKLCLCIDEYVDTFLRHFNATKQPVKLDQASAVLRGYTKGSYGVLII